MKNLILIIVLLRSCGGQANPMKPLDLSQPADIVQEKEDKFELSCEIVNSVEFTRNVYRCENKEVICYQNADTGLQCKFK